MGKKSRRYERSFLLMLCLYPAGGFSGYYLNPYSPATEPVAFETYKEFEKNLQKLIDKIEIKDAFDEQIPIYVNWYQAYYKNMRRYIIYVKHKDSGRWVGDILNTASWVEQHFVSKNQLNKYLINYQIGL